MGAEETLDLQKYTKSQLLDLAEDDGIEEVDSSMTKKEIVEIMDDFYEAQANDLDEEFSRRANTRGGINPEEHTSSVFDNNYKSPDRDDDMAYLDDDEITNHTDIFDKILNPHIVVRLVRKRFLYEVYNPITRKFVRVSRKRPLASKGFISRFESRVLSFTNTNFYQTEMDWDKDIVRFAKRNLKNFNDELLNAKEINEHNHMIFFDIFHNLLKAAIKNAENGSYRDFVENIRSNRTRKELDNDRREKESDSPSFRDEFAGAA